MSELQFKTPFSLQLPIVYCFVPLALARQLFEKLTLLQPHTGSKIGSKHWIDPDTQIFPSKYFPEGQLHSLPCVSVQISFIKLHSGKYGLVSFAVHVRVQSVNVVPSAKERQKFLHEHFEKTGWHTIFPAPEELDELEELLLEVVMQFPLLHAVLGGQVTRLMQVPTLQKPSKQFARSDKEEQSLFCVQLIPCADECLNCIAIVPRQKITASINAIVPFVFFIQK